MAKEKDITTIRIPISVKAELDGVANDKEPYHATIQRLISENKQLKKADERNDALMEMYKFQMHDLRIKADFLDGVMEHDYEDDVYNYYLKAYRRLDSALFCGFDASEDERYTQLKDAYADCVDELENQDLEKVLDFAKLWCYDEFGLLAKLEDEMND